MIRILTILTALALTVPQVAGSYAVRVPVAADGLSTWTPEPTPVTTPTPDVTVSAQPVGTLTPLPLPVYVPSGAESVASVARAVGWPEYAIPAVIAVTQCESGWSMSVIGAAGEVGVMQIHPIHFGTAAALGYNIWALEGNLGYGLYLWQQAGWSPWTCARIVGVY